MLRQLMGQIIMVVAADTTSQNAVNQALATIESCEIVLMMLNKAARRTSAPITAITPMTTLCGRRRRAPAAEHTVRFPCIPTPWSRRRPRATLVAALLAASLLAVAGAVARRRTCASFRRSSVQETLTNNVNLSPIGSERADLVTE